jgi:hypothetical protein
MKIDKKILIKSVKKQPFYICPICNYTKIENHYKYCPVCGRELIIKIKDKQVNKGDKVDKLYEKKYGMKCTDDFKLRYPLK